MKSYFIFNDIDSRMMGVILDGETPLQRAKERVTQITVPGRAGILTLTEGEDVYEPYIQSVTMAVRGTYDDVRNVMRWLRGDGYVSFSNDPNHKQHCRVINAISFTKVSTLLDWYKGTVQFYCDPFKTLLGEDTVQLFASNTVINDGDVNEYPVLTLRGEGELSITVNGSVLTVNVAAGQGGAVIDCDVKRVLTLSGGELITAQTEGDFPVFVPGRNEINFTADSVFCERRRRYL